MPVPAMAETVIDHQRRFQAAVDVIHNLPKNGFYRPSYEMMLRFYSLYKQAVCGPCAVPRPGFWDPVGRYKWDAWSELGQMSSESAMAAYVNEIKKVAQEVIDTMPMNEKTASLLHHFEPLYLVIDDMPRPPESLLALRQGGEHVETPSEVEDEDPQGADPDQEVMASTVLSDSGVSKALVLNSDSESEIFCDSVDSVEQLSNIKVSLVKSNGFNKVSLSSDSSAAQSPPLGGCVEVRQVGAGQGGEGADDGNRRGRTTGQERTDHSWRERGAPRCSVRRVAPGGGGAGQGGGDGSEGGMERLRNPQLQQQIIAALRRLRDDMRSVMIRLEVVERLAASHTLGGSEWRPCMHCAAAASQQQEESWWPFDVSAPTVLLFLLWPFVAQGLLYLLRKTHKRRRVSS